MPTMIPTKAKALLSEIVWVTGVLEKLGERFPADTIERLKLAFWCLRCDHPEDEARELLGNDAIATNVFDSAMRQPVKDPKPIDRKPLEIHCKELAAGSPRG